MQEYDENGSDCYDKNGKRSDTCTAYLYWNEAQGNACGTWGRDCICVSKDKEEQNYACALACRYSLRTEPFHSAKERSLSSTENIEVNHNMLLYSSKDPKKGCGSDKIETKGDCKSWTRKFYGTVGS